MDETGERRGSIDGTGGWMQVRPSKASSEIVAQIRERFFCGAYEPGSRIGTERGMAEQFGVSRLTMRDALRILEASGIVEVKVGKSGGVRIAAPGADRYADALAIQLVLKGVSAAELLEAQIAIEAQAVQLAAARATGDDIASMETQLKRVRNSMDDHKGFVAESQRFHLCVVVASQNRALIAQFQALQHLSHRIVGQTHTASRAVAVVARHEILFQAIAAGNAELAADTVKAHLRSIIDTLMAVELNTRVVENSHAD
ncbi:MAG: FadR family transcriptional regulator [Hyphomicrobiales bacterium]|nr:FadR family transcriptional regulator [Hyphomicrobiales bacterium]